MHTSSTKMLSPHHKESGSGGLWTQLPKEDEWVPKVVHFMDHKKISELPSSPKCPSLIALYLQGNYELTAIPRLFFQRMALLQVLDLSHTSIKSLPKSLPKLVALKKLLLRRCDLFMELSPHVGKLKNLEELDLDETQIMDLPKEIGKLLALKYLRVWFYPISGKKKSKSNILIQPETLSNLSQLIDLSIDVDPRDKRWDDSVEVVVKEVCKSKTLRTLSLYLPKFQLLQYMSSMYPSLSHFRFTVGHIKRSIISRVPQEVEAQFRNWEKCLKFVNGENIPTEIKRLLSYSNSFFLDQHRTAMNLSEFGIENMKGLKSCLLAECNQMETIIDEERHCEGNEDHLSESSTSSVENVLESLEYLGIYYMENLGSIWTGPTPFGCMSKLKFLALHSCPQLSNVFSPTLLENLINLEEFILEDCPLVTSLVSDAYVKPIMSYEFLPSLKRLLLLYLPQLVSISKGLIIAPKLESIGFYNCPKLKRISKMELSSDSLKIIKGERKWWEDTEWNETEWGNWPEYLMRIFSPINNEEDVMTQMAEDRVLFEATIRNEALQLDDEKLVEVSTQDHKGQWSEHTKESISATDLTKSTPSAPEIECTSFSSDKNNRVELEDDQLNLASEICELYEANDDEPKAECGVFLRSTENANKDVIVTKKGDLSDQSITSYSPPLSSPLTFRLKSEVDVLDDGYSWRKYGEKAIKGTGIPSRYRNSYKCVGVDCPVKKMIQRDLEDTSYLEIIYKGMHNHDGRYVKWLNKQDELSVGSNIWDATVEDAAEAEFGQKPVPSMDEVNASSSYGEVPCKKGDLSVDLKLGQEGYSRDDESMNIYSFNQQCSRWPGSPYATAPSSLHRSLSTVMSGAESFPVAIGNSRYLRPAQSLLDEVVNVADIKAEEKFFGKFYLRHRRGVSRLSSEIKAELCSNVNLLHAKNELQIKLAKLIRLLEEVEDRYENYYEQMEELVSSFEAKAGNGVARSYTALALQAMSRHFGNLREAIISQINEIRRKFPHDLPKINRELSQHSLFDRDSRQNQLFFLQLGMIPSQRQAWRPVRGLPETSVTILRTWLFEHFLHPYPTQSEKQILASQTGLTRSQVSYWFINARMRLWKPLVEEMYLEGTADSPQDSDPSLAGGSTGREGIADTKLDIEGVAKKITLDGSSCKQPTTLLDKSDCTLLSPGFD